MRQCLWLHATAEIHVSSWRQRERKINSLLSLLLPGLMNTIIQLSLYQSREKTWRTCKLPKGRWWCWSWSRRTDECSPGSGSRYKPTSVGQVSSESTEQMGAQRGWHVRQEAEKCRGCEGKTSQWVRIKVLFHHLFLLAQGSVKIFLNGETKLELPSGSSGKTRMYWF